MRQRGVRYESKRRKKTESIDISLDHCKRRDAMAFQAAGQVEL
jgi:hypothetical protein